MKSFAGPIASLLLALAAGSACADDALAAPAAQLATQYTREIRPLVSHFCGKCHSGDAPQGDVDLNRFATLAEARQATKVWQKVAEQLDQGEMPPPDSPQLALAQRRQVRDWVAQFLRAEALANAGDPGPVGLRRLNNAELNFTIADLTGVDLRPARELPADSAAGEGFTNAANAQAMSPALLAKYLDAGKDIARHAVLLPDGFRFSKHTSQRDWTNELLDQIRAFYRQRVDLVELGNGNSVGVFNLHGDCRLGQIGRLPLERYMLATLAERPALSAGTKSIRQVAAEQKLNAKYLARLWAALNATNADPIMNTLRKRWQTAQPADAPAIAADVAAWQRGLWSFNLVGLLGRKGSGTRWQEPATPIVAEHEIRLPIPAPASDAPPQDVVVTFVLGDCTDGNDDDFVIWKQPRLVADQQPDVLLRDIPELKGLDLAMFGHHPIGRTLEAASLCLKAPSVITLRLPSRLAAGRTLVTTAAIDPDAGGNASAQVDVVLGTAEPHPGLVAPTTHVTFSTVTALFPDHRTVTYQRPILTLAAGPARQRFETSMDEFRQLLPVTLCYPQVIPADEVLTLTQFHREDEHLIRLMLDEREQAELDRLWAELRFVSQDPLKLAAVLDSLVETTKDHPQDGAFKELVPVFRQRAHEFRQQLVQAEPQQLAALVRFAERAQRRPLEPPEAEQLRGLYQQLRSESLSHEDAFRLVLARVFVAPSVLFRVEAAPPGSSAAPVTSWELATRLSYFLWSSLPDASLLASAADGTLSQPDELARQTRRMLADERTRRLAVEFGCQWLHVYDFPLTESKNQQLFPEFPALREDLYEEVIRFLTDLLQHDGSLLDVLNADHTYVNGRLAKFYDMPGVGGESWRRVDGVRQLGRGGVLGFAVVLAKQSGASRTSPILRGNWVSEVLLGERLPRPPKNVPQLADEVPAGLTERQLIERHSHDAACAKCHERIDPLGFALEGFDAIGRRRERTPAGEQIDTSTKLADGREIAGLAGLRDYLREQRRDAYVRQFCRKLLGYALGRETQLSDQPLLDQMQHTLAGNNYRLSTAILAIVQSRQFREIRGQDHPQSESP